LGVDGESEREKKRQRGKGGWSGRKVKGKAVVQLGSKVK